MEVLKAFIDWGALAKPLASELTKHRSSASTGRKRFDFKVIVRCFILQRSYDLSDSLLESEIADRRSFRIFVDLTIGDTITMRPSSVAIANYLSAWG